MYACYTRQAVIAPSTWHADVGSPLACSKTLVASSHAAVQPACTPEPARCLGFSHARLDALVEQRGMQAASLAVQHLGSLHITDQAVRFTSSACAQQCVPPQLYACCSKCSESYVGSKGSKTQGAGRGPLSNLLSTQLHPVRGNRASAAAVQASKKRQRRSLIARAKRANEALALLHEQLQPVLKTFGMSSPSPQLLQLMTAFSRLDRNGSLNIDFFQQEVERANNIGREGKMKHGRRYGANSPAIDAMAMAQLRKQTGLVNILNANNLTALPAGVTVKRRTTQACAVEACMGLQPAVGLALQWSQLESGNSFHGQECVPGLVCITVSGGAGSVALCRRVVRNCLMSAMQVDSVLTHSCNAGCCTCAMTRCP